ncbi:hypothetical protein [Bradyrhizobium guangzhouense]|uniref:Uncharacterized protein n=1 Tax=Bradyrhizobium guangzhouense TaxID=1325095 RepID=A0AAE6CAH1_9BRAD|nr:hypothetical protein [Bradyrhizobium guangzhouense]QAU48684.1 hypothetical protein XH91_27225 [Bradyrhizobium guangzhouense]RXH09646.1 hypothetical protein EAS56_25420 [Bradyrhizobium guangzhouense]
MAAEAEQRRKEDEAAVVKALAERQAAEAALTDRIASEKAAADLADQHNDAVKVADLPPAPSKPSLSSQEMIKLLQSELLPIAKQL